LQRTGRLDLQAAAAAQVTPSNVGPYIAELKSRDVTSVSYGRLVRRGRDLITATYAHIGPDVSDPSKRFAGNNLACGNCHL
jgi:cytochrome c